MKKILSIIVLILSALITSCSTDDTRYQEERTSNFRLKSGDCPDGYVKVKYVDFDGVNFRTRRSDCTSNFGLFCLKGKTVRYECVHYLTGHVVLPEDATLIKDTNGVITTGGVLILSNGGTIGELRLPIELVNYAPNGIADFNQLDIEGDYVIDLETTLKAGTYSVTRTSDEIIVTVPIL